MKGSIDFDKTLNTNVYDHFREVTKMVYIG